MGNFVPPNATEPAHSQSIVTKAGAYTITDYQHFFMSLEASENVWGAMTNYSKKTIRCAQHRTLLCFRRGNSS